jgi:hypothetical protein
MVVSSPSLCRCNSGTGRDLSIRGKGPPRCARRHVPHPPLTFDTGTATAVSFDLTSIGDITHPAGDFSLTLPPARLIVAATIRRRGTFSFSAQGNNIVTFSATTLAASVTTPVPLPGTLPLFASGLAGLVLLSWRKKRSWLLNQCWRLPIRGAQFGGPLPILASR